MDLCGVVIPDTGDRQRPFAAAGLRRAGGINHSSMAEVSAAQTLNEHLQRFGMAIKGRLDEHRMKCWFDGVSITVSEQSLHVYSEMTFSGEAPGMRNFTVWVVHDFAKLTLGASPILGEAALQHVLQMLFVSGAMRQDAVQHDSVLLKAGEW